ncbi:MAG: DUF1611 domain-containing protein [Spirochaetia bacterium]|jgi:uncharacterized NAD-dependent epimerase/dehydratase family protein|nr:DUF1611 domain-containing protein [Spirochaetia bacterium]
MKIKPEGNAIVFCEGAFSNTYGKTAHGLVRFTKRYKVLAVVDSQVAGREAGEFLDGKPSGIPIFSSLKEAVVRMNELGEAATHMVVGIAPDGGGIDSSIYSAISTAISLNLNIDSGLHDFVGDISELKKSADARGLIIRDIRKTASRKDLHSFTGRISDVNSTVIAILGTDSAIGKRTTAWKLVEALLNAGFSAELIGTGQTAWMQGAEYSIILDSLINDFVSGEIENAVWNCWNEKKPDFIIIEGQGSLMNPAYPGGFEILAAGRPDGIVLQHAPGRKDYDGFPGYPLHSLEKQIHAVEFLSGKPVVAITVNHEGLEGLEIIEACNEINKNTGLPALDPLTDNCDKIVKVLKDFKGKH